MPTMLRLGAVVMKVSDLDRARAFWSAALALEGDPHQPAFLLPEDAAPGTRLHLDEEDRMHLDLCADDEADQRVEWDYPRARTSSCWRTRTATCSASSPDALPRGQCAMSTKRE